MTLTFRDANPDDIAIVSDFETTGLNVQKDLLLEGALIAVDTQFNELGRLSFLMNYELRFVKAIMNDYVRNMHEQNGLLKRLEESQDRLSENDARTKIVDFVRGVKKPTGRALMMGNSLHGVDYPFLKTLVPAAFSQEEGLHYRTIDVSGIREGIAFFTGREPYFEKDGNHRAMTDAMQCLEEYLAIMKACIKVPD